ncbi:hypothetical protein [Coleofasciculus sp. G2-EDA-02]|uniref:hypothetical protein n=1 Tax=Coleofasciculus sp. G2-EDA-02 TaxID=3069529 RepID=UPI0032F5DF8A
MQKILIVGERLELGRTEEVYGRGFSNIGCEVKYFTWQEARPNLSSNPFVKKVAWRIAWQWLAQIANQKLIDIANKFKPELTFVVAPLLVDPNTIQALQRYGLVFVFFTDNPLDQHHTHSNYWVRGGLHLWDAVFIWSQELANRLTEKSGKKAFFHSFCSDIKYHYPKKNTTKFMM